MKKRSNRSSLLLMELIIVIMFFSIAAAICLTIFADASSSAKLSEDLSNAVLAAQSAAECYKNSDGDIDRVAGVLGGEVAGGRMSLRYSGAWERMSWLYIYSSASSEVAPEGFYLELEPLSAGSAKVSVTRLTGEVLFSLTVKCPGGDAL